MMGDGIAFEPVDDIVYAPCDAVVSSIALSKHAIGLTNNEGLEILIHIGLDTVNYQGKGFQVYVSRDQKVKRGDALIQFDFDFFKGENVCLTTPMIFTNYKEFNLEFHHINETVKADDIIVTTYQKN